MKPNLFRSINNALAERFPLLPRIRRSFIGLLMFCIIFILIDLTSDTPVSLPVEPAFLSRYEHATPIVYENVQINPGQLTIPNPTILERLLIPSSNSTNVDPLTLFFILIGCVIIIWMVPKLQQQYLFRKDISNAIRSLGYLMILHGTVYIFRMSLYLPNKVRLLTHNDFLSTGNMFPLVWLEWYFALIVIALGGIYERGVKLQEEQDLTV